MRDALQWGNSPVGTYSAPIYLGLARGAFGPPDVRIEVTDNLTGADYTENLVAGRFDMGHIGSPPLFAALARTDAYAVVGQAVMPTACFYVIAPPGVRSMAELKGKVIALNKLRTCPHSIVRTALRQAGVEESEVTLRTLVEGTAINEAIARGEVAAAVNWEPYVSQAERRFGWRILADGRTVIEPANYGYLLYARRELLRRAPELVARMIHDYGAAVKYAVEHLDEAAQTLEGRIPGITREDIDSALRRDAPSWTWNTTLDRAFIDRILVELRAQAVVMPDFDVRRALAA
jgi:ABC-type nitrate/sulfonate/bicarbonate transport system substrate-binding protein